MRDEALAPIDRALEGRAILALHPSSFILHPFDQALEGRACLALHPSSFIPHPFRLCGTAAG
jgi:hypothetical protein